MQLTTLLLSIAMVIFTGLILILYQQHVKGAAMINLASFLGMKLRTTKDTLRETEAALEELEKLQNLRFELTDLNNKLAMRRANLTNCWKKKTILADELKATLIGKSQIEAQLKKDRNVWTMEVNKLKENLSVRSKFCNFVEKPLSKTMQLCKRNKLTEDAKVLKEI